MADLSVSRFVRVAWWAQEVPDDEEGTHPPCCSEMGYVVSI